MISILKLAGIETTRFGAHSTRAASSSAAKKAGAPIADIRSTGARVVLRTHLF